MTKSGKEPIDLVVRKMTLKDYDSVIKLWKHGKIPYRPQGRDSKKNIRKQFKEPTSLYFVAEVKKKIVGAVLGTHDGRKGWINRLVVSPSYQRRGIARRLVQEVENRLAQEGIDIVASLIEKWNGTSMNVFKQLGYTEHPDIFYFSKRKKQET